MQLYIGNKNYSSWSLRPWLLMRQLGIAFDECRLRIEFEAGSAFKQAIGKVAPTGKVPVLVDDGFAVWDTLAIVEYLAEKFPDQPVWPQGVQARARARSLCAEMHSGFAALRNHCPMNIEAELGPVGARLLDEQPALGLDLTRIHQMWRQQLAQTGGPFLCGEFGAIDAYFAPVCARIRTYGLPVPADAFAYVERVFALPEMQRWVADARAERDFLADDEPYRSQA